MEACPKCNFALVPEVAECPACGVILAKLKAVSGLQRQIRPVPTAVPSNPYAPPTAEVESPPPPIPVAAPVQDVITRPTLAALEATRPWLRFLVIYGFAMIGLMLLAAFGLLVYGREKPQMVPIAILYFVYAGIALGLLLPLHRSSEALGRLAFQGASASLEAFVTAQSSFWRRMGAACAVSLALIGVGVAVAFVAGVMMAVS